MTLAGCSASLDDIRPKDQIPSDNLTEEDLVKVLNGVYATMEDHVHNMWWDGDVKGENYRPGPGGNLSDPLDMSPSSSAVRSRWNNCFTSLKQVNFLIENYETNSNKESATVKQSGGTGYFFRALIYYNAVTRWGKAPIMRKRTYDDVPLSGEAEVWSFILEDLDKAESLLSPFTDRFYVSASACDALKARVYIAIGDKGNALTYADRVISSTAFSLANNSTDWAKTFVSNSSSSELVFSLANKRTKNTILMHQKINDVDGSWDYSPAAAIYSNLYSNTAIKSGDIRAKATFNSDPTRTIKFANGMDGQFINNEVPSQTPLPVLRLAEMYLIKAEAQGANAGLSTMKEFMQKRYSSVNLPSSMSDTDFQNLILDERQRELYSEGFRWYDLKRTGRLDLFSTLNGRNHLMYWPIPQSEIDLAGSDKYPQNPGYGSTNN